MSDSTHEQEQELRNHYEGSSLWAEDARFAKEHFEVVHRVTEGRTAFVEGKSCFGTRYVVMLTRNPKEMAELHEATHTVGVLHPWRRTILMNLDVVEAIDLRYLRELLDHDGLVHGGDLMGVALCLAACADELAGSTSTKMGVRW